MVETREPANCGLFCFNADGKLGTEELDSNWAVTVRQGILFQNIVHFACG
jgi:hypothetical protein